MTMAALITNLFLHFFFVFFFPCLFVPLLAKPNLLSCENDESHDPFYGFSPCIKAENQFCSTYAVLLTNSYYSSLYNLSSYLGLNRFDLAESNGFSADTEFLPRDQPLLIPIDCKCASAVFQAEISRISSQGESYDGIAESLEGLTTCKAIRERNPGIPPWNLSDKIKVSVPLRCGCPTSSGKTKFLVSYPVRRSGTLSSLASQFNTTLEEIFHANNKSEEKQIVSNSLVLIPQNQKPLLGSLAKPSEPSFGFPEKSVKASHKHHKKLRMLKLVLCVVFLSIAFGAAIVGISAFFIIQKRKKQNQNNLSAKMIDVELQQLSLSIRTTSEKKVSFEGSQSTLDGQVLEATTPRNCKIMLETYTLDELKKSTEDFNSHNLIEGSVYLGRLKGKNVAIKSTTSEFLSKFDFSLFQDAIHNHLNIMRVLGSCSNDGAESYLVFEYAKNGSLKDWIHGGLAMKSHFIASCSCFLTWRQRLQICLDVALALQYMHHIMHPVYVHRNIKSRNIFLDEEFNAKIGNFGMSKFVVEEDDDTQEQDQESTQFSSRNPASWTKGYLAPEYVNQGVISPSIDVFAYGVVLLEVLSGETPVICTNDKGDKEETIMLWEKIMSVLQSENQDSLRGWIDPDLGDNYPFEAAVTLATLARACVDDEPSMRPSAGDIVEKLSRLVEESPEGDNQFLISESSSKPLVQAAASNND